MGVRLRYVGTADQHIHRADPDVTFVRGGDPQEVDPDAAEYLLRTGEFIEDCSTPDPAPEPQAQTEDDGGDSDDDYIDDEDVDEDPPFAPFSGE